MGINEISKNITQEEVLKLIKENGLTVEKVIDVAIDTNHFIGVGLIALGDQMRDYIYHHKESRLNPIIK